MKKCLLLLFISAICFLNGEELNYWFTEYYLVSDSLIVLNNQKLVKFSEKIEHDTLSYKRDVDYEINYDNGLITLISADIIQHEQLKISYKIIPPTFLNPLFLYRISVTPDSTYVTQKKSQKSVFLEDNKLLINGSKTFAVSFSDNKSFDVNQSLYLKLSGEIASNLNIEAQLSDSNSPISVEGGSREFSSLDKVFITLFNDNFELSFGDLTHEIKNTSYINYISQFDGLKVGLFSDKNKIYDSSFNIQNRVWGALAVSQGKNDSYRFNCLDGKQGPYYIYISGTNEYVSIIANSETLYIDGIKATRGIDYYLDYSEGSITFEKLVTSENEIYVTFEYTNEKYRNNLYLASSAYKITDYLNVNVNLMHRADDSNNPLEDIHTEEDIEAFAEAGDNPVHANGIFEVEVGEGRYIKEITGDGEVFYVYDETGLVGNHNIYFSPVGVGQGSYQEYAPNKFEFVGTNNGNYEPIRILAPPQRLSNYDVLVRFGTETINLELESLFSEHDENTLSSKDDSDNQGNISKIKLNFKYEKDEWRTSNYISWENKSKNLATFADLEDPLELGYAGVATEYDTLKSQSINIVNSFDLNDYFKLNFLYRNQKIPTLLHSNYISTSVNTVEKLFAPRLTYQYVTKDVEYSNSLTDRLEYTNHLFSIGKKVYYLAGVFETIQEKNEEFLDNSNNFGYQYKRYKYTLQTNDVSNVAVSTSYWNDKRLILKDESWDKTISSRNATNELLLSFENHNTNINHTIRKIESNQESQEDQTFNMININSNHNLFANGLEVNYNYKVNNLEFYPKVRELIFIGEGAGDYDSLGVFQDTGDFDWFYVNAGTPELSTELNLSMNSTLRLSSFTKANFWKGLTAELRTHITEDSKTPDKLKLYLLNSSVLMNPNSTLYGRRYAQNNYVFNSDNRKYNYKLSFEWDDVLDNRYQDENKTIIRIVDNEFMLRRFAWGNSGVQFTYKTEEDTRYNSEIKDYITTLKYQQNFSQNYIYSSNLKLLLEKGKEAAKKDDYKLTKTSLNNVITANFARKYLLQFNSDLIYTVRSGSTYLSFLPEKREGFAFKWNLSGKYSYNQYISVNLSYFGDKYPQQTMANNLNIEIKAEF